jgi:serine protease inhibitor
MITTNLLLTFCCWGFNFQPPELLPQREAGGASGRDVISAALACVQTYQERTLDSAHRNVPESETHTTSYLHVHRLVSQPYDMESTERAWSYQSFLEAMQAKEVLSQEKNFACSPYGIEQALAVLEKAAAGRTKSELEQRKGLSRVMGREATPQNPVDAVALGQPATVWAHNAQTEDLKGHGLKLTNTPKGSAFQKAGINKGDLLFAVNGTALKSKDQLDKLCQDSNGEIEVVGYHWHTGKIFNKTVALRATSMAKSHGRQFDFFSKNVFLYRNIKPTPYFLEVIEEELGAAHRLIPGLEETHLNSDDFSDWINGVTAGRFDEISLGALPPDTRALIANLIRIHCPWDTPFKADSSPLEFHSPQEKSTPVRSMSVTANFEISENTWERLIRLNTTSPDFKINLWVPRGENRLDETLERLKEKDYLSVMTEGLSPKQVKLTVPHFTSRTSLSGQELVDALSLDHSNSDQAEFPDLNSGMADTKLARLSQTVDVDFCESGLYATATTLAAIKGKGPSPQPIDKITVDRPFAYEVVGPGDTVILFGVVHQPTPFSSPKDQPQQDQ